MYFSFTKIYFSIGVSSLKLLDNGVCVLPFSVLHLTLPLKILSTFENTYKQPSILTIINAKTTEFHSWKSKVKLQLVISVMHAPSYILEGALNSTAITQVQRQSS